MRPGSGHCERPARIGSLVQKKIDVLLNDMFRVEARGSRPWRYRAWALLRSGRGRFAADAPTRALGGRAAQAIGGAASKPESKDSQPGGGAGKATDGGSMSSVKTGGGTSKSTSPDTPTVAAAPTKNDGPSPKEILHETLQDAQEWLHRDIYELDAEINQEGDRLSNEAVHSQDMALIALVWVGDEKACDRAAEILTSWKLGGVGVELLMAALERHRPEVAKAARRAILRQAIPRDTHTRINPPTAIADLTLDELRKVATAEGYDPQSKKEAMRRWLVTDASRAIPALLEIMRDEKHGIHMRCLAATVLAVDPRQEAAKQGRRRRPWLGWRPRACATSGWAARGAWGCSKAAPTGSSRC